MNQVSKFLRAMFEDTQCSIMSPERLLHRTVAQVFRDLSKADIQIQQLQSSMARIERNKDTMTLGASNAITRSSKLGNLDSRQKETKEDDSALIEIFGCVSRLSSYDTGSSIDALQARFFGSPDYRFESLPSFYPEQYVSEGSVSEDVFLVARRPSTDKQMTFRYFLDYAKTARHWQKAIMVATFCGELQQTDTLQVASSGDHVWGTSTILLPSALHNLLRKILPFIEFHASITQIALNLTIGEGGQIIASSPKIEVVEDDLETSESDEKFFLQYIDSISCERYVESNVVTCSRISSTSYKVYVNSRACVENKALFVSGKGQGNNAFLDYLDEIKHCISLRHCANVLAFRGVVLDDTRRHLRSYLKELPLIASIGFLLELANSRRKVIPLIIREIWARQIIQAILEMHNQSLIAAVFRLSLVGIRADGSAVFHYLQRSKNYFADFNGQVPPELRHKP